MTSIGAFIRFYNYALFIFERCHAHLLLWQFRRGSIRNETSSSLPVSGGTRQNWFTSVLIAAVIPTTGSRPAAAREFVSGTAGGVQSATCAVRQATCMAEPKLPPNTSWTGFRQRVVENRLKSTSCQPYAGDYLFRQLLANRWMWLLINFACFIICLADGAVLVRRRSLCSGLAN